MVAILRSGRSFEPEVVPEVESYIKIGNAIPYILNDVLAIKKKLMELWHFQNLTYF